MAYFVAIDLEQRCVVWLFTGPTNSDADFAAYCASIVAFDAQCAGQDGGAVIVVDPGNPPPPSAWRKKIAEASANLASKPAFALVSTSSLIRGVLTAINWLRPPTYPFTASGNLDDAIAFVEGHLKRPVPVRALVADVRAQASRVAVAS